MKQDKSPPTHYQNIDLIAVNDLLSVNNLDIVQVSAMYLLLKLPLLLMSLSHVPQLICSYLKPCSAYRGLPQYWLAMPRLIEPGCPRLPLSQRGHYMP